ncbi:MAG: response regulator [Candidatus Bathyarchaeia archaeon]
MEEQKKSILVVDDDKAILKYAKGILLLEGYDVDVAETGFDALEKSNNRFYNLALLDIMLPDIQGTELLTKMHRTTPKTMKIMVTGFPSFDNAVEALNMGADAYLLKPVEMEELLSVVKEKLYEQEEAEKMSEEQVADWINIRIQKLRANNDA